MTDMNIPQDLLLSKRDGLPDALRALIKAYPRAGWVQNPNYSQLIAFWLDRHLTDEEELVVPVLLKYDPPQFR